jgi:hypothetical protein
VRLYCHTIDCLPYMLAAAAAAAADLHRRVGAPAGLLPLLHALLTA